jgi:pantetheine-phosphate adenylyltransferase/8-oxo-dGTP diphosphatase
MNGWMTKHPIRHGVYAGVFDPLTLGHWSIIQSGVYLFDRLTIGIGRNAGKAQAMFTAEERQEIISESLAEVIRLANGYHLEKLGNVHVEIFEDEFLVKFAERLGANYILRGIRDSEDFRQERAYNFFNKGFAPHIESVYMMPDIRYEAVSSSAIKGMIGPQGWEEFIKPFLTTPAYRRILEKYGNAKA